MCCYTGHHGKPQTSTVLVNADFGDDGACVCPGTDGHGCCGYATQKDGQCDRCRTYCKAPDTDAILEAILAKTTDSEIVLVIAIP